MTTKEEIRNIQCQQVNEMEAKLRFIAENVEEIILALRIKQAQELEAYAKAPENRIYDLWRGSSIDFWVFERGMRERVEAMRETEK